MSRSRPRPGIFLRVPMTPASTVALDAAAVSRSVKRLAHEIAERNSGAENIVLVGVIRRGAALAERLLAGLKEAGRAEVPAGTLDISSYRDDEKGAPGDPRLHGRNIPFSIDGKRVVLVDDVLYTGRTVRAALEALCDLGRPESIQLAVLVDRGEREVPIRADYVGKNIPTPTGQRVYVKLSEVDGFDGVLISEAK